MYQRKHKKRENESRAVASSFVRKENNISGNQPVDNRPEAVVQRRLYTLANSHSTLAKIQQTIRRNYKNQVVQLGAYNIRGGYTFTSKSGSMGSSRSYSGATYKKMATITGTVTGPSFNKSGVVHAQLSTPRGKIGPSTKITHTSGAHLDTGAGRYYPFSCGYGAGLINGILLQMLNEHINGWDDYP